MALAFCSPIAAGLTVGISNHGPKLWTENGLVVPVCFRWTNATGGAYAMERQWIREAVEGTWGQATPLQFAGWATCPETGQERHVRVRIERDTLHPCTSQSPIGAGGHSSLGMNTFNSPAEGDSMLIVWNCAAARDHIQALAVHEFGHALGFNHEHNRLDRASSCTKPFEYGQGWKVGPYDNDSVMTQWYCNSHIGGYLSWGDQVNARFVYGRPRGPEEQSFAFGRFAGGAKNHVIQTYRKWSSIPKCEFTDAGTTASCTNHGADIYNWDSAEQKFIVGDFDADGREDVVQTFRRWASLPLCRQLAGTTGWTCENLYAITLVNTNSAAQVFIAANVDGVPGDEVVIAHPSMNYFKVCKYAVSQWSCTDLAIHGRDYGFLQRYHVGDFDGNGFEDIALTHPGQAAITVCLFDRNYWVWCNDKPVTHYDWSSAEETYLPGDFNGDGRTDFVKAFREWGSYPLYISNGGASFTTTNPGAAIYNANSVEQQFLTGDFNRDGKTDIVQTYRGWGSIPVCTSTGSGWNCSNPVATVRNSGSHEQRFYAADVDGDGATDVVQAYRGWPYYIVCRSLGTPTTAVTWSCRYVFADIYNWSS
jgi:hypothetical protein